MADGDMSGEQVATWLLTFLDHTMHGWDGDEDTLYTLGQAREWVLSQLVKSREETQANEPA